MVLFKLGTIDSVRKKTLANSNSCVGLPNACLLIRMRGSKPITEVNKRFSHANGVRGAWLFIEEVALCKLVLSSLVVRVKMSAFVVSLTAV